MFMDGLNQLPIGGGIFLTIVAYIAASFFILGPLVSKRSVELSGFVTACERTVVESVKRDTPQLQQGTPTPDCESIMGVFAGRDGEALCGSIGFMFENPLAAQVEAANERLIARHRDRVSRAALHANTSCTCAVNVAAKENASSWALAAGSLRFITPAAIENYQAELSAALNSDYCQGEFR